MQGEIVTVLVAGTTLDPYSQQPVQGWTTSSRRDVMTDAPPEPRPSDEPVQDSRNAMSSGWTLYFPPGDPIARTDYVEVRGEVYPVQGVAADWGMGVVVQAFRTEG